MVVAESGPQLVRDGGAEHDGVELTDERSRDLAQDRQLRDAQRLLRGLAARGLLHLARLHAQAAHLLDEARHLAARADFLVAAEQRAAYDVFEVLPRERLDQILERAVRERLLDRIERRVGGDHHRLDRGIGLLHAAQDLEPVHLGHLDVEDHEVGVVPRELGERGRAVVGRADLVGPLEEHPQRFPRAELVVDDEDARADRGRLACHTAAGSLITKATSWRPWRSSSRPPSASTMR